MSLSTPNRQQLAKWLRRGAMIAGSLTALGFIIYAFLPSEILVDLDKVTTGPLEVMVREEGKTRIRERYVISSSLAGRVLRLGLDPGDAVTANETILATIEPADPSLLDARSQAQAEAKVQASEAGTHRAEAELKRAEAEVERAQANFKRFRSLSETRAATKEDVEEAELRLRTATEQHAAAQFAVKIAQFEFEQAKAALLRFRPVSVGASEGEKGEWRLEIPSPINGRVLRVFQESAAVVTPGAPLVEVGDPRDLEIEVDVLSEDAVKVRPGNEVRIEQWGGGALLEGRVRLVEPRAFTKISALGVEEQRVNIIIDFTTPIEERDALGDGYRVETEIVIWRGENVTMVPVSCLFRKEEEWGVYAVREGRAYHQPVKLGERNNLSAEVLGGLKAGDVVIVHPGDQIEDGVRIKPRS